MNSKDVKVNKPGSKKKQIPKLKNVLAYPFPQYWPALNIDQITELKDRIQLVKQDGNDNSAIDSCKPIIGLSKLLREVNRNEKISFFLSTDIKPKFIATQIINLTLSRFQSCKVLCIPNLKDLTKTLFGIESIAFGYKEGHCPPVEKWIKETQEKCFPVPDKILSYYAKGTCKPDENINNEQILKVTKHKTLELIDTNSLYLRRITDNRAFKPANAENIRPCRFDELERDSTEWSDFISLSMKPSLKIQEMDVDEDSDDSRLEEQKLDNTISKLFAKKTNGNMHGQTVTEKVEDSLVSKKSKRHTDNRKLYDPYKQSKKSDYIGLTVNRIQPNPDKVKKKKKKNKNFKK